MAKTRSKSTGTPHRFGGDWTQTKLDVLKDYLAAYTKALKDKPTAAQPFRKAYIDAFAGTGSDQWSAFRNGAVGVHDAQRALGKHVGRFIEDVAGLFRGRLSELPESELPSFARRLTKRCQRFGQVVKGTPSCVMPSKAAHLLLPTLVPAYDNAEIRNRVLAKLVQAGAEANRSSCT